MRNDDYSLSFTVDQSPLTAFSCITNARGWWSETVEGESHHLGAVFYYHYQDVHRCTFKVTELKPGKRVVWHVLHNDFSFIEDKSEWSGTDLVFDIEEQGEATEVRFTHVGLVPDYECYEICSNAWRQYITSSLYNLIKTGKGEPNRIERQPEHQEKVLAQVDELTHRKRTHNVANSK